MSIPVLLPVDKWIIERTKQTINRASGFLNEYEIGSARHEFDDLFWKDFCDYYLEIVKDRLYKPEIHGIIERKSAQYALYYCLLNLLKLYAIYVPHITEFIYQQYFRQHEKQISLHILTWNNVGTIGYDILCFGDMLKSVITDMRKYKSENNLSMKSEIEQIDISVGKYDEWFKQTEKDIKACCKAKVVKYVNEK